jgi:ubiquinone/menaquinone biosynthesis C-methylase UbiE
MDKESLRQLDEIQLSRCLPFLRKYYQNLRGQFKDFQELVKENLKPELRVLDAGCGDGQWGDISQLISSHSFVVGIDEDEESLKKNTTIKQLFKGDLHQLPFGSSEFDLVICRSVFEHLADPKKVIAEFKRVLSDQGRVIVYTQNRCNPVMFLSSIMPVWLRKILKIIIMRKDCDEGTYKAFYKCNTKSNFRRLFRKEGFKEVKFVRHGQCPGYWKNSLFLNCFLIFEKLTDWKRLNFFKAHIVAVYEK